MSLPSYRLAVATVSAALVGLACVGTAVASAAPATSPTADRAERTGLTPVDFVNLSTRALPVAGTSHTFLVAYRNNSSADQVVAPQILVESPDAGPFLASTGIQVERRNADGFPEAVPVGSQAGTLFTDLVAAQRTLRPGESFTERFRITVTAPGAVGTVLPRVALYG